MMSLSQGDTRAVHHGVFIDMIVKKLSFPDRPVEHPTSPPLETSSW